ncbi:choice-of-anchor P family protein [Nocardioides sp. J9]|uniref:choice-of-anchor P family protein n=1 Tax=Nocardioides sp. J9 TaxID=935844 RepID=UPI001644044B|nr:choice-of-anchor P family protein [Nocardioides sp. J9]
MRLLIVGAMAAAGLTVASSSPATAADATVAAFNQCANGTGTATTCAGGWINGAIQGSNSHFREDDVVPHRAVVNLPADDLEHTLTFTYQDRKGSIHAYDSMATWNHTVEDADPCQGLSASLCADPPSTLPMATDGAAVPPSGTGISPLVSDHDLPDADREWTMYGGVLVGDSVGPHSAPAGGDDLVTVSVTFRNPTPGQSRQAVLLFGGHLAVGGPDSHVRAWGQGLGASNVSGGPYAFKLEKLDGKSTGAMANTIQANATQPLPPAAFAITKTASTTAAVPGQQVTYTITVTNTGGTAGSTSFTDDFDDAVTPSAVTPTPASGGSCTPATVSGNKVLQCTSGSIAGGEQQVFTYTADMPATFSGAGGGGGCEAGQHPVRNRATLVDGTAAPVVTVCVAASPQFSITKTASPASGVGAGDTVTYTVTVTNSGKASGSTTFTDDFDDRLAPSTAVSAPSGNDCAPTASGGNELFSCTTGTIAPGGSQAFTYAATMPATFAGSPGGDGCAGSTYPVANTAALPGGTPAVVTLCVQADPQFEVTKTVDDAVATPGQEVTYTVTVTNNGKAPGTTTFRDDFDDRLSPSTATSAPTGADCEPTTDEGNKVLDCTTGTIPAGGSQTFTYSAAMPTSFSGPSGGEGCEPGTYPVLNAVALANAQAADSTVCVGAAADFEIAKSVDDASPEPGATVTYTVTVTNTGKAAGSTSFTDEYDARMDVTLPDDCEAGPGPASFTCETGEVAAGDPVSFTYTAVVPATFGPTSGGGECAQGSYPIGNTASLAEGPGAAVELCVAAAPSYTVTKAVSDTTPHPGQQVTYTITVTNEGDAAGATAFEDDFDDRLTPSAITSAPDTGTCSVVGDDDKVLQCATGVIPAGESQVFTYDVTLPATFAGDRGACAPGSYEVANAVELSDGADAGVSVCVPAAPAFSVAKSYEADGPLEPGGTVTYTITVTNGGTAAGATSFTDDVDDRLTVGTATSDPEGDDCEATDGVFSCDTGVIPAGGSQTFTYVATLPAAFDGPGGEGTCEPGTFRIHNLVELADGARGDVTFCVGATPDFGVVKTAEVDGEVAPGAEVSYTITVTNSGTSSGSTTFVDDFDDRLDPTVPAGCEKADGKLTCTTGVVAANGGTQVFTYSATLPTSFTGESGTGTCDPGEFQVANRVRISGTTVADADVCVPAEPGFLVTKEASSTTVAAGDPVTYTITVTNTGEAPGSTTFTDEYDERLPPPHRIGEEDGPVRVSSRYPVDDLDPPIAVSDPEGNDCAPSGGVFDCTTTRLDPGDSQTFTYTVAMPASFAAGAEQGDCADGRFSVLNTAETGDSSHTVEVCVSAAPAFEISKEADLEVAGPGGDVTYQVVVRNTGDAAGSTTWTDVSEAEITEAPDGCELVGTHELRCETPVLAAGESITYSYDAVLPATYTGDPDAETCTPPAYPVRNVATLAGGGSAADVVCVDARTELVVAKSVDKALAEPGDEVTYTITVTNTGAAAGSTTFVDDYDDRLTPTVPDGCEQGDGMLTCTTGTIAGGDHQVFEYTAELPSSYDGESGVAPCAPGEYGVVNSVTIQGAEVASKTVCVPAAPDLSVAKEMSDTTLDPGQEVTYTVTVTNDGSAAGSTSFTDDYDDRLDPTVPDGCTKADGKLTCETGTIAAGGSKVFTYTATVPETFTGTSGGNGCQPGTFAISNGVLLASGATGGVTGCVAATPDVTLTKTSSVDVRSNGDQVLTYTITWTNHGPAEALGAVLTDAIPGGTGFVSCTGGCTVVGAVPTASWNVGSIAPRGGTGSVRLVVKVTNNAVCTVPNQARMSLANGADVSSNVTSDLVSPQPNPAGAKSNGTAVGLEVRASGLLTLVTNLLSVIIKDKATVVLSESVSSQSGLGGPSTDSDAVAALKLPANGAILSAGVLSTTSNSSVTAAPAETRQTTTSEVAGVCLVPVAGVCTVETGTVRAVASTTANGGYSTASTTGSTIQSLKVLGLETPVNLNQTTTIPLNAAIFGKNSYIAINERSTSISEKGGKYVADASVTAIHVKITGVLLGLQAVEIKVGEATAHSEFPKTPLCANQPKRSVSGHAYAARLGTNVLLADLLQGYVQISPLGGDETEQVVGVALPGIVGAKVADTATSGALTTSGATARSWAEVAGDGSGPLCVLRLTDSTCVVSATAVRSEARSTAGPSGSTSTDAGTTLVDLEVLGVPVGLNPAPNTTYTLPGIGFIVLNEQFCDGGGAATHSCSGTPHSGIAVRALRVVVTVANALLPLGPGIEVMVAEAHADSSFG